MNARAPTFQRTGFDVGKSTLVASLCRLATRRGLRVAPFKPQNISSYAAACAGTIDYEATVGCALQALADGLEASLDVAALFADASATRLPVNTG